MDAGLLAYDVVAIVKRRHGIQPLARHAVPRGARYLSRQTSVFAFPVKEARMGQSGRMRVQQDRKPRRPVAEFVVVSIEPAALGIVALIGLTSGRGRGRCGDVCRMATPYLVAAVSLCTACLLGLAATWVLGRSAVVRQPERIASWMGISLLASVLRLFVIVILRGAGLPD